MKNEPSAIKEREPIPWKWLGAGLLIAVAGCIMALILLRAFLAQMPEQTAEPLPATIIVLTAPPSPTVDPTGSAQPPTPIPTFTPIPTPDAAIAPAQITISFYAVVANTDGLGVTLRQAAQSTLEMILQVVRVVVATILGVGCRLGVVGLLCLG